MKPYLIIMLLTGLGLPAMAQPVVQPQKKIADIPRIPTDCKNKPGITYKPLFDWLQKDPKRNYIRATVKLAGDGEGISFGDITLTGGSTEDTIILIDPVGDFGEAVFGISSLGAAVFDITYNDILGVNCFAQRKEIFYAAGGGVLGKRSIGMTLGQSPAGDNSGSYIILDNVIYNTGISTVNGPYHFGIDHLNPGSSVVKNLYITFELKKSRNIIVGR